MTFRVSFTFSETFLMCAASEPHVTGFPPYYKSTYAWESLSASYDLHPMSFSPTVLQHASGMYSNHVSHNTQLQQPLQDCTTHYSPTSNTYHCITCDKVSISNFCRVFFPHIGRRASCRIYLHVLALKRAVLFNKQKKQGVLHISRTRGPRQKVPQRDEAIWLQRL